MPSSSELVSWDQEKGQWHRGPKEEEEEKGEDEVEEEGETRDSECECSSTLPE